MEQERISYRVLAGKPEGERDHLDGLGTEEGYYMDLKEIRWEDVDWIHLAQEGIRRVFVSIIMNFQVL